jgi:hypothetical protein
MYDWKSVLDEGSYNPALLQILSFHNSAGGEILDTTTMADASVLLPMVNGALASIRRDNDEILYYDACFILPFLL